MEVDDVRRKACAELTVVLEAGLSGSALTKRLGELGLLITVSRAENEEPIRQAECVFTLIDAALGQAIAACDQEQLRAAFGMDGQTRSKSLRFRLRRAGELATPLTGQVSPIRATKPTGIKAESWKKRRWPPLRDALAHELVRLAEVYGGPARAAPAKPTNGRLLPAAIAAAAIVATVLAMSWPGGEGSDAVVGCDDRNLVACGRTVGVFVPGESVATLSSLPDGVRVGFENMANGSGIAWVFTPARPVPRFFAVGVQGTTSRAISFRVECKSRASGMLEIMDSNDVRMGKPGAFEATVPLAKCGPAIDEIVLNFYVVGERATLTVETLRIWS